MGLNSLDLTTQEEGYRNKATKSVVAIHNLKAGDTITLDSVSLKRSFNPITDNSILEIEQAIGRKLRVDVEINTPILKSDI